MRAAWLLIAAGILLCGGCADHSGNADNCPPADCSSCGDRVVWISAPKNDAQARIGDIVHVTVNARSAAGITELGFVALGELAGIPLQLAHETADGGAQSQAVASFELAVPFNANIKRIVLVALAEDAQGFLRSDVQAFVVNPYE